MDNNSPKLQNLIQKTRRLDQTTYLKKILSLGHAKPIHFYTEPQVKFVLQEFYQGGPSQIILASIFNAVLSDGKTIFSLNSYELSILVKNDPNLKRKNIKFNFSQFLSKILKPTFEVLKKIELKTDKSLGNLYEFTDETLRDLIEKNLERKGLNYQKLRLKLLANLNLKKIERPISMQDLNIAKDQYLMAVDKARELDFYRLDNPQNKQAAKIAVKQATLAGKLRRKFEDLEWQYYKENPVTSN